jgi:hypothetical protein
MPVISGGIVQGPGGVCYQSVLFTETSGAGTYTGSVTVPAGAILLDVTVHGIAVWNPSSTVAMTVGDAAVADGILTITSLKAAGDLVAGESLSVSGGTSTAGGEEGGDVTGSAWTRRYLATERVISGVITAAGTGGTTGRTLLVVTYTDPIVPTDATKA